MFINVILCMNDGVIAYGYYMVFVGRLKSI